MPGLTEDAYNSRYEPKVMGDALYRLLEHNLEQFSIAAGALSDYWGLVLKEGLPSVLCKQAKALEKISSGYEGVEIGATPYTIEEDVGFRIPSIKLRNYGNGEGGNRREKLLGVYAKVNTLDILDLDAKSSVIRDLMEGLDPYFIDWGNICEGSSPTLEDCLEDADRAVDYLRKKASSDKINTMGYCQGAADALLLAYLTPEKFKDVVLLTPAIGRAERIEYMTPLEVLSLYAPFDLPGGKADAKMLNLGFTALNWGTNVYRTWADYLKNSGNPGFEEKFWRIQKWMNSGNDVPEDIYRRAARDIYQGNQLLRGEFKLYGEPVDLSKLSEKGSPLFHIILAEKDHLVNRKAVMELAGQIGPNARLHEIENAGHVGASVGRNARKFWKEFARELAGNGKKPRLT